MDRDRDVTSILPAGLDVDMLDHRHKRWYASDAALAQQIFAILTQHYPGWGWTVDANSERGTVHIWNSALSERHGFRLMMREIQTHGELTRAVMRAGGEFLERHAVMRGRANDDVRAEKERIAWKS